MEFIVVFDFDKKDIKVQWQYFEEYKYAVKYLRSIHKEKRKAFIYKMSYQYLLKRIAYKIFPILDENYVKISSIENCGILNFKTIYSNKEISIGIEEFTRFVYRPSGCIVY